MNSGDLAIQVAGLRMRFGRPGKRVDALRGIGLAVEAGSVYALVGPNGAGKSTLIKILMNLVQATGGQAVVLGRDARDLRGAALDRIGYVSENQKMPDWMTAGAMLRFLRVFYPTWDTRLEAELVRQFDLPLDRRLKGMSRGMRMKAALAAALAFRPRLIVLDEPFSGLDPLVRDELAEGLLGALAQGSEEADAKGLTTILISSHDLAEVESFASHVGYLEGGRLLFSEELGGLLERFREAEIVLTGEALVPQVLPESWMGVEAASGLVRLVESDFELDRTETRIAAVFTGVQRVEFRAMTLREVFLAMAKAGRARSANAIAGGRS